MKCPACQRETEPTSRFCTFCGAVLPALERDNQQNSGQDSTNKPRENTLSLQEEIRRLSALVTQMNTRLSTLEQAQGITTPPVEIVSPPSTPEKSLLRL